MFDHYAVLGVSRNASPGEIKRAYREQAKRWHPDRPGGDTARFQRIGEAYRVLSDPDLRREYDEEPEPEPEPWRGSEDEPGPYTPGGYYGPLSQLLDGLTARHVADLVTGRLDLSQLMTGPEIQAFVLRSLYTPREQLAQELADLISERLDY